MIFDLDYQDSYDSHMKKKSVGTAELKNNLSAYLQHVRKGLSYVVTDRGEPVAELTPVAKKEGQNIDEILKAMAEEGVLTLPTRRGPLAPFKPVKIKGKKLPSQILIEMREERDASLLPR